MAQQNNRAYQWFVPSATHGIEYCFSLVFFRWTEYIRFRSSVGSAACQDIAGLPEAAEDTAIMLDSRTIHLASIQRIMNDLCMAMHSTNSSV